MRRLVALLACTTALLAGTTLYLWFERSALQPTETSAQSPTIAPAATPIASASAEPPPPPPSPAANAPADRRDMRAEARAALVDDIPALTATLENPARHEIALREIRALYRRTDPRIAETLGMSEDEYARLLQLMADQQIRGLEERQQCALKPECDIVPILGELELRREREMTELLGAEKSRLFAEYRDNGSERNQVIYLRGVLPDSQPMTNQQADALVAALGDERRKILREWQQRGAMPNGISNSRGSVLVPSTAQGSEQKVSEATEYQRRLSARASTILNPQQLGAFEQVQADVLEGARIVWERDERTPR